VLLCQKTETDPVSEASCLLKELDDKQSSKKRKNASVNFSHAVFSLLSTRDNLVMQALVSLHMVLFRIIWFDMVQFGTSYTNLR